MDFIDKLIRQISQPHPKSFPMSIFKEQCILLALPLIASGKVPNLDHVMFHENLSPVSVIIHIRMQMERHQQGKFPGVASVKWSEIERQLTYQLRKPNSHSRNQKGNGYQQERIMGQRSFWRNDVWDRLVEQLFTCTYVCLAYHQAIITNTCTPKLPRYRCPESLWP